MANLETLELRISANAQEAQKGLSGLISSLKSLQKFMDTAAKSVSNLNDQLSKLKQFKGGRGLNLDKIAGSTNKIKEQTSAIKEQTTAVQKYERSINFVNGLGFQNGYKTEEERRAKNPQWYQDPIQQAYKAQQYLRDHGGVASWAKEAESSYTASTQKVEKLIIGVKNASSEAVAETHKVSDAFKSLKTGFSNATEGITHAFSRIKRIATTMLIRKALRSLVAYMKEGVANLHGWSKEVGGEFAAAMQTASGSAATLKNSLGAALAPIIQALIPLFNSLSSAIITAANWINQFISLLSGSNSWTKAVEQAGDATDDLANSAGGAGKAAKEMLAAFDELNVIGNESGGGGGGGSSIESEYTGLFEKVNAFNEKIKEITAFIQEHLEEIKVAAIGIGAAILSWKLGTAFAEVLPALTSVLGFVGTIATITVAITLNWLFTNQYLDTGKDGWLWAGLLTSAIGSTAAWAIANKLIGGSAGYYAATITLAATAITDIAANIKHTDVSAFDEKSIKTNIKAALEAGGAAGIALIAGGASAGLVLAGIGGVAIATFAVATLLKLATSGSTEIEWGNLQLTQEQIDTYVKENMFTAEAFVLVNKISMNLDSSVELEGNIREKVSEINSNLNVLNLGVDRETTLANIAKLIGGDESGTGGLVADIASLCDMRIDLLKLNFGNMKAYDGEGNEISSDVLLSGIEGWKSVKEAMEIDGKELTRLLFKGATEQLTTEEQQYVDELLKKVTDIARKISNAQEFAGAAIEFRTAAIEAMSKGSVEGIISAFENYSDTNAETIRQGWLKTAQSYIELANITDDPQMKEKYLQAADDIIAGLDQTVAEELANANKPGIDLISEWLKKQNFTVDMNSAEWNDLLDDMGGVLSAAVETAVNAATGEPLLLKAANLVGISGWDLLERESKESLIKALGGIMGDDTISRLKNELNVSAEEIFSLSGWDGFTREEKFNFLEAIKEVFGEQEAITAAKNAGINIGQLVGEGMGSSDPKIREAANKWREILQGTAGKVNVKVEADKTNVTKAGQNANTWFKKAFNKKVQATVAATQSSINKLKKDVDNAISGTKTVKPVVDPQLASNFVTNLSNKIKDAVKKSLGTVNVNVGGGGGVTATVKSSGGFVGSGQLFLAREAGAEMVGAIGNNTAVANNQQIVDGISSGVAKANSEQNALLRRQNELLAAILAKTGNSGIPGASSALGRTVSQSLQMYNAMVGGR